MALLVILAAVLIAACRYPQDPRGTLDRVTGGVMHVGVSENPPWVIRTEEGVGGLEPELIRNLAEALDADVRWHWGSAGELIGALEHHQLDLVAGGLTRGEPLQRVVAFTNPYVKVRIGVGVPGGQSLPEDLDGLQIAVSPVNTFAGTLRDWGAEPMRVADLAEANGPAAAPQWWLEAHGFRVGPWTLREARHVMAVPAGENAWLLRLQRHLDGQAGLHRRLREIAE